MQIFQSRLDALYIVYDPIAKVLINTSLFRLSELSLFIGLLVLSTLVTLADYSGFQAYSQTQEFHQREFTDEPGHPRIYDPNLHAEVVVEGLELPTTMAFLGPNDMLVLEKEKGTVQRIIDGKILPQPLLDVNVAGFIERCMCGIAISTDTPRHTYVFLFYTEAQTADREDMTADPKAPLGNRLYRYELVDNKLVNPKMLLDLPADPGPRHNGGEVLIGPDNNLYITVGDVDGSFQGEQWQTRTQNYQDGAQVDGRSGILRMTQDGVPVPEAGILGQQSPLNMYYAYGIRNSFGIDFDPITGNIWDTENGPGNSDEINLVEPGFNSGWREVQGMTSLEDNFDPNDLVDFGGKGKYSDPEFVWADTVGPTALKFLNSDKLGMQYVNDMFVGDVHNGRIYHFKLNENRMELILDGLLADKVADADSELEQEEGDDRIIFGQGFGGITDLEVGPDGYLYVVSIGEGAIYRIVSSGVNDDNGIKIDKDDEQDDNDDNNNNNANNIRSEDSGDENQDIL